MILVCSFSPVLEEEKKGKILQLQNNLNLYNSESLKHHYFLDYIVALNKTFSQKFTQNLCAMMLLFPHG
jgi:hypothetical protein